MKLFKLKRKNIILVSLLAIAGFLGISSVAVNTATSKEAPVAEKADAASYTTVIYFNDVYNNTNNYYSNGCTLALWMNNGTNGILKFAESAGDAAFPYMKKFEVTASYQVTKFNLVRVNIYNNWPTDKQTSWPNDHVYNQSDDVAYSEQRVYKPSGYSGDNKSQVGSEIWSRTVHRYTYLDGYYSSKPALSDLTWYYGKVMNFESPSDIYGYTFDGYYWTHDDTYHTLSNPNDPTARMYGSETVKYLYAKYTRESGNKTYYVDFSSCSQFQGKTLYVYYYSASDTLTWPGLQITTRLYVEGNNYLYSFSLPTDTTEFIINANTTGDQFQTVDIGRSTEHNLFRITTNSASTKQNGEWKDVIYYLEGDETFVGSGRTPWDASSGLVMHEPVSGNGNDAELTNVTVNSGSGVKICVIFGESSSWVGTLGASYTFARNRDGNIYFENGSGTPTATGKYSFYLKQGNVYIENDANKENSGYIYFSSTVAASDIRVTATANDSYVSQNNVRLSSLSDFETTSSLTYNGIKGMHKISVYTLRGNHTSSFISSLQITAGGVTRTYTLTDITTKPVYYIVIGSTALNKDSNIAKEARVAFMFDQQVNSASNSSVCNIKQANATTLCDEYDSLASKTYFDAARVTTWDSTKPTYEGSRNVPMTAILYQVSKIAADGKNRGILGRFGGLSLFGSEDNFSTIIIIISSSVALLSVTALSILVIRKRKSKED